MHVGCTDTRYLSRFHSVSCFLLRFRDDSSQLLIFTRPRKRSTHITNVTLLVDTVEIHRIVNWKIAASSNNIKVRVLKLYYPSFNT